MLIATLPLAVASPRTQGDLPVRVRQHPAASWPRFFRPRFPHAQTHFYPSLLSPLPLFPYKPRETFQSAYDNIRQQTGATQELLSRGQALSPGPDGPLSRPVLASLQGATAWIGLGRDYSEGALPQLRDAVEAAGAGEHPGERSGAVNALLGSVRVGVWLTAEGSRLDGRAEWGRPDGGLGTPLVRGLGGQRCQEGSWAGAAALPQLRDAAAVEVV